MLYPGAFPNLAAYTATRPIRVRTSTRCCSPGCHPSSRGSRTTPGRRSPTCCGSTWRSADGAGPANILGVVGGDNAGFPNGRRVFDDVVSIELKAVAGALLHDVVPSFTPDAAAAALYDVGGPTTEPTTVASLSAFGLTYPTSFPYLSDPWDGLTNPATQPIGVAG